MHRHTVRLAGKVIDRLRVQRPSSLAPVVRRSSRSISLHFNVSMSNPSRTLLRSFHTSPLTLRSTNALDFDSTLSTIPKRTDEDADYDIVEGMEGEEGKLGKLIRDSIRATGPIPISQYMQFSLGHPIEGYYTRDRSTNVDSGSSGAGTDVFGKKGDFITSPEISQLFGELIAVWYVKQWMDQGRPKKVRLIELGPGRGTLLDDILRTMHSLPTFPTSAITSVHMVETSAPLRAQQRSKVESRIRTFGDHAEKVSIHHSDRIEDIPFESDTFNIIIAHEFFDALPINVFQKTEGGFREVCVNLGMDGGDPMSMLGDKQSQAEPSRGTILHQAVSAAASSPAPLNNSGLTLGLSKESSTLSDILPATSPRFQDIPVGERVEISSESWQVMRCIGELVSGLRHGAQRNPSGMGQPEVVKESESQGERAVGGAALVIDYGSDKASSNSFRAFRNHEIVHIFDNPGSADLTANVDFAYMKESVGDIASPHGPISQRDFLIALGLGPRLDQLLKAAKDNERRSDIANAARRLIDSNGMGEQYKFLAVTPKVLEGHKEVYPFESILEIGHEDKSSAAVPLTANAVPASSSSDPIKASASSPLDAPTADKETSVPAALSSSTSVDSEEPSSVLAEPVGTDPKISSASSAHTPSTSTSPTSASSDAEAPSSPASPTYVIPRITLFSGGPECSLCDIMKEDLAVVQFTHPFELEIWNIHDPPKWASEEEAEMWKKAYVFEIPVLHMNGKFIGRHRLNSPVIKKQIDALRSGDPFFHVAHLQPSEKTILRRGGDPLVFQVDREAHLARVEKNQKRWTLEGRRGEPWEGRDDAERERATPKKLNSRQKKRKATGTSWSPPQSNPREQLETAKVESKSRSKSKSSSKKWHGKDE